MINPSQNQMRDDLSPDRLDAKRAEIKARKDNSSGKGCWYMTTHFDCPVCGKGETIKERKYGNKPATIWDQHEYVVSYDYCNAL